MADENNYILEGQLYGELRPGFNYMGQREMFTLKLLQKDEKKKSPIRYVFDFKFEKDGKFKAICRCDSSLANMSDGLAAEQTKLKILGDIQALFEIGHGFEDLTKYEGKRAEVESKGILPLSYFTNFEKEKKDEK